MIKIIEVILCLSSMLFPIMVYYYYLAYKKDLVKKEKNMIYDISLITMIFICISLLFYFNNQLYSFLLFIPLLFSYLKNDSKIIVLILLIISIYFNVFQNVKIEYLILANVLYFINYYIYKKTILRKEVFITFFYLITIFITILNLYFMKTNINFSLEIIILMLLFLLLLFLSSYINTKAANIINLHLTLNEFEKEKVIQSSFFKITHEIKNPLAVCKGYLSMINVSNKEKTEEYVDIVKGEIERTLILLDDFRSLTKINIEKKVFDVNLMLEDLKGAIAPILSKYNSKIIFMTEEEMYLNADYNRLKQVIINLIKNSLEAHSKNIVITVYNSENKNYIAVKDDGIGMSAEEQQKLKVPFFTTKQMGTGLGVCLSSEIINAHKGNLKYRSKLNEGTTAKIVLPK